MFSVHMPISLLIVTEYCDNHKEVLPLSPKLLWNCQNLNVYQLKMDLCNAKIDYEAISFKEEAKFTIDVIK